MGAVAGLCAICHAPGAMHSCMLCGRQVCVRHFRHGEGVCLMHPAGDAGPGPAVGRS